MQEEKQKCLITGNGGAMLFSIVHVTRGYLPRFTVFGKSKESEKAKRPSEGNNP